jgi:transposase
MTMLADAVDIVIGVDTHKHTHTPGQWCWPEQEPRWPSSPSTFDDDGYQSLVDLAGTHGALRAWAVEGTGGYGAGLAKRLVDVGERVIELDRPTRPTRRGGAKSDPIDAVRAAREALGRTHLAQPRARGERAALSVLLAARSIAIDATRKAQYQLHALVVAAP